MFKWAEGVTDEAKTAVSAGLDELSKMDCVAAYKHAYRTYASDEDHLALIADVIKPAISARAAVQFHFDG